MVTNLVVEKLSIDKLSYRKADIWKPGCRHAENTKI